HRRELARVRAGVRLEETGDGVARAEGRGTGKAQRRVESLDVDLGRAAPIRAIRDPRVVVQPTRGRLDGVAARHDVDDASRGVDDDDLRDVAAQPPRRGDVRARVRPARLRPLLVVAAGRDRRDALAVGRDERETCRAGSDLSRDDETVAAYVRRGQALAERELALVAAALNPEVGTLLVRIDEVYLRIQILAGRDLHVGRTGVAPADARTLPVEIHAIRPKALTSRRATVDDGAVVRPARREHEDAVAREIAPTWNRRLFGANRPNDGIGKFLPRFREGNAEALFRGHVHQIRNDVGAFLVDEVADARLAARAREIIDEERTVAVLAERKAPLRETQSADARKLVIDRRGARDHAMLGALDPSRAGELRFLVDRESFNEPRRRVEIRKERIRAAEDVLAERP